jgi:aspartyl-tRNA(Asn)/glutamyl-tRNA(Gln) amidotransferase subunit B
MEEGSMRADVNVSVRKPGAEFGTRTETKNVNSVRFVMQTIEHEAMRQVEVLEDGGTVVQETRLFDPDKGTTRPLRSKEDAHDYRYFPDPDLLPLELDEAFIEECSESLPELPDTKRKRYEGLGITPYNASVLTAEVETARWFDQLIESGVEPKAAANWVLSSMLGVLNARNLTITTERNTPQANAAILSLVSKGVISRSQAPQVFEYVIDTGDTPEVIVEREGLKQESDTGAIDDAIDKVLADNSDKVQQYKGGKEQLFGFFVGQTMKAMAGKANPQVVNERLRAKLS